MLKKSLQFVALFLMLIVLPAGSWYYLSKGMDYRLEAKSELGDFGKRPPLPYTTLEGSLVSQTDLSDGVFIVAELDQPGQKNTLQVAQELGKIHTQFDARKDIFFLILAHPADSAALQKLLKKHKLIDPGQVFTIQKDALDKPGFNFAQVDSEKSGAYIAITDTAGQIRQYYDFRDGSRVKRLVEHITILMPVIEREQAILKREKEK